MLSVTGSGVFRATVWPPGSPKNEAEKLLKIKGLKRATF